MDSGLLFYFARRTDDCHAAIEHAVNCFGISITKVMLCNDSRNLDSSMANVLKDVSVVLLVSSSPKQRPECAEPIFETLRIPTDGLGEPIGVMKLHGVDKAGYLIESADQAIVILPDIPCEIEKMLSAVCGRLKDKFRLKGEMPRPVSIDCKKIAADCLEHSAKKPIIKF